MEEVIKKLPTIDWYSIGAIAAISFGILKSILSGWNSGRKQEKNSRFVKESQYADITPVQGVPGERTRIQAMEENQHRELAGIAALRADVSASIANIERLSTYMHGVGEDVSHNGRILSRLEKDIKCLKHSLTSLDSAGRQSQENQLRPKS